MNGVDQRPQKRRALVQRLERARREERLGREPLYEVLPNISSPLLVEFGLRLTYSIIMIAALSFLGFGMQPPSADWGLMINENRIAITVQPWAVIAPVVLIAALTISTNLMADGLARAMMGIDRNTGTA